MFRAFVYVRKIHEQQRWHRRNSCHHTYKSTSKWNVRITMTMLLYFREWWILWQRLQYATQCFYHDQRIVIELTTESCEVDNYSWQQGSMEPGISYAVLYFFFLDGECAWRQKYISIYSMQHIWLCSAWSWTIFTDVWYASHCLLHWTNDKWCSGIDTTKQRAVCCAQVKVVLKLQCKVEVMSSEVGSVCLKPIGLKAMRRIPFEGQECAMLENLWGSQSKV